MFKKKPVIIQYWDLHNVDYETIKSRLDDLEGENHFLKQEIKQLKQTCNPLQEILNRNVIKRLGELEEWQQKVEKTLANMVTGSKSTKQKPKK